MTKGKSKGTANVRLLFVDEGSYHQVDVQIPKAALSDHERLIDCIREDPAVLKRLHIDFDRLVSVSLADDQV